MPSDLRPFDRSQYPRLLGYAVQANRFSLDWLTDQLRELPPELIQQAVDELLSDGLLRTDPSDPDAGYLWVQPPDSERLHHWWQAKHDRRASVRSPFAADVAPRSKVDRQGTGKRLEKRQRSSKCTVTGTLKSTGLGNGKIEPPALGGPQQRLDRNRGAAPARTAPPKRRSTLKHAPQFDRPRERLLARGAASLRTADLLAILIRAGRAGESALQAGERVAAEFAERLEALSDRGPAELKELSRAIGPTAYCQIMAGIELGRRVAAATAARRVITKITSSQDAIAFCSKHFLRLSTDRKQEEFHIVTLDTKNQVIATHQITIGTLDASLVHPREVFRPAIRDAASSILLAHNHPSGDATPSPQDLTVTERLEEVGRLVGIDVLDHIVVTPHAATSIREYR